MSETEAHEPRQAIWRTRNVLIAFAAGAAVLNTLQVFRSLLYANARNRYFIGDSAPHDHLAALALAVVVGLVVFVVARWIARSSGPWGAVAMIAWVLLLTVNPLEYLRVAYFDSTRLALLVLGGTGFGVAAVVALLAWLGRVTLSGIASGAVIAMAVFAPFALTTGARGVLAAVSLSSEPERMPLAREGEASTRRAPMRVVWVIFDELDRRLMVAEDRVYEYPNFDAFRARSVDAAEAIPPAGRTIRAIPSFWLGRRVERHRLRGPAEIEFQFAGDNEWKPLSDFDTVFEELARDGLPIGAVGFHHPYCRLLRDSLNRCVAFNSQTAQYYQTTGFADSFLAAANVLAPNWRRRVKVSQYLRTKEAAYDFAADPDLDFVALHFNVPHDPPIYAPETSELRTVGFGLRFEGNIVLADRALGGLMAAIEEAGLAARTAVIVGSDHGWKKRKGFDSLPGAVPLMTHLPGQQAPIVVDGPVESFTTRPLILALLRGEARTPEDVAALLRAAQ